MSMISIKNLDVVFGEDVEKATQLLDQGLDRQEIIDQTGCVVGVNNATLNIEEGEICVLMGLSGSGKSSLLRTLNGLNPITRGSVCVKDGSDSIDLATCTPDTLRRLRTERISMVFQKFALMPWLSVLDNVAFGLELKNVDKKRRHIAAMEKLEMVGLQEWAHSMPAELSGGMQQRVGLARAFAMDSDIMLMDEPFSALDPLIRAQLQDELLELQKNLKKTILFVSHDLDEALKIGSHIGIMESAKLIQYGKPEEIVLNPENDYVENFVAHTNPMHILAGKTLMTPLEQLPVDGSRIQIDPRQNYWIELKEGEVVKAGQNEIELPVVVYKPDAPQKGAFTIATPEISMRDAVALKYATGLPIIIAEAGKVLGALNDDNFYYALLGNHFTAD